jgi:hypothetical protein
MDEVIEFSAKRAGGLPLLPGIDRFNLRVPARSRASPHMADRAIYGSKPRDSVLFEPRRRLLERN